MTTPWRALNDASIGSLPAQLGVYEIADHDQTIVKIGFAGGNEPFGIRTALERELESGGVFFRHEFTHGYLTRWQELLMVYRADHGILPFDNRQDAGSLGRLSPGAA